jgi:hypothetical protein
MKRLGCPKKHRATRRRFKGFPVAAAIQVLQEHGTPVLVLRLVEFTVILIESLDIKEHHNPGL